MAPALVDHVTALEHDVGNLLQTRPEATVDFIPELPEPFWLCQRVSLQDLQVLGLPGAVGQISHNSPALLSLWQILRTAQAPECRL